MGIYYDEYVEIKRKKSGLDLVTGLASLYDKFPKNEESMKYKPEMKKLVQAVENTKSELKELEQHGKIEEKFNKAVKHFENENYYEAEKGFREVLKISPCDATVLFYLGVCLYKQANIEFANCMNRGATPRRDIFSEAVKVLREAYDGCKDSKMRSTINEFLTDAVKSDSAVRNI
ncbi:MAG: hypothetical protein ACD_59C00077G0004 [uncultured bacterium]|nr:MAG: hypothetical protein ACD_59C00077G0004 [uncultured bacterium]